MKKTSVTKQCTICGADYEVKKHRASASNYCSRECWSNRNPPSEFICPHCGETFTSYHRDAIYCSRSCRAKDKTGKDASAYVDGKSMQRQRARDSVELAKWREKVYKRDGYTCQYCGANGCALNAHHIKPYAEYPKLRVALDNGVTLCIPCHEKVHGRKMSSPSKYPTVCQDCGANISGQSYYCRSCSIKRSWVKRRQK